MSVREVLQRFRMLTEEERRRARLLQHLIISFLVFSIVTLPLFSYVMGLIWRYVVIGVFLLGTLLPVYLLLRKGHVRLASWILVFNLQLLAVAIILTSGGVKSPGFAAFLIIIFFAGLLLGGRAAALIALLSTLSFFFIWLIERWLPEPAYRHDDLFYLTYASFLFFLTYFIHDFSDRIMRRTVERLRREVSVRRLAEERYRSVIAALDEGIVVQDRQGVIIAHNRRAEEILGMTAGEAVPCLPFFFLIWTASRILTIPWGMMWATGFCQLLQIAFERFCVQTIPFAVPAEMNFLCCFRILLKQQMRAMSPIRYSLP